ncbi:unnamed protein product [Closterium sp. NIES-54]
MLPASPQQNGIAERRIRMVMDVARTSMIHAAAPHFLWPFAVQYAAHQINLQPCVSLPETTHTLRWTGKVGDASAFRVWGSRAFVRETSADKLSSRAVPCVFLGFPPDAHGWQFYHPTSRRVLSSQDVTFDESVSYYRLFPYRTASLPPPAALPRTRSSPDVDSGAARGTEPAGAGTGGVEPGVAESEGAEPGGAELGGAEPERADSFVSDTLGAVAVLLVLELLEVLLELLEVLLVLELLEVLEALELPGVLLELELLEVLVLEVLALLEVLLVLELLEGAGAAGLGGARTGGTGAAGAGGAVGVGAVRD